MVQGLFPLTCIHGRVFLVLLGMATLSFVPTTTLMDKNLHTFAGDSSKICCNVSLGVIFLSDVPLLCWFI